MKIIPIVSSSAAAFALLVSTPAFATAGTGFHPSGVVLGHYGSFHLDTQNLARDKDLSWSMVLKTMGDTDVGVDRVDMDAGGYTGWHAHPSAVFITVTQGSIVWSNGSNPLCPSHTYHAGDSFIEDAYIIHNVRNASNSAAAQFIGTHINPTGTSGPGFVLDRAEPNNCKF